MQRPLVSSKQVILKIVRDLNLGDKEIPWQDMVEWIAEGMQHIGAIGQLVEKEATIAIENYQGKLPCDFYSAKFNNNISYKIVGDTIQTKVREGYLMKFRYMAMPLDEEGFPLIPDHVSYSTALFWKVAMQLSIRGQLPNKELTFSMCMNRWNKYCGQAGSYGHNFTAETVQRYAQAFTARIPDLEQYSKDFNNTEPLRG